MRDVVILLSTYNGARFLPEQLDSIGRQEGAFPRALFWRDDGSTDGTPELLRAARLPGCRVLEATALTGRLGAARSFLALLAASPGAAFHAFCDQDDVWLPDKLARATARLDALPEEVPALYCGRQQLVDAELRPVGLSPLPRRPPGFANALVQNIATGCTVVLNAAARRLMLAAPPPPPGSMHDWWCYLLVSGAGGQVLFDADPCILYRQHGANVVGAPRALLGRGIAAFRRGPQAFLRLLHGHLEALAGAEGLLTPEAAAKVSVLREAFAAGPLRRLRALRQAGVYRQTLAEDLTLRAWCLLGADGPGKRGENPAGSRRAG